MALISIAISLQCCSCLIYYHFNSKNDLLLCRNSKKKNSLKKLHIHREVFGELHCKLFYEHPTTGVTSLRWSVELEIVQLCILKEQYAKKKFYYHLLTLASIQTGEKMSVGTKNETFFKISSIVFHKRKEQHEGE